MPVIIPNRTPEEWPAMMADTLLSRGPITVASDKCRISIARSLAVTLITM